ncbi:MAG TPA: helix-turn-helix transcriptional regulator [Candidatus Eisenbacteria bacterium]|nr:helix-turn-helix transcriptional regulator [Candidatus Eisenbacteria bacterium]
MPRRRKPTTDALAIIDRRYYSDPKRRAEAELAYAHACMAQEIYRLRTKAGLTQAQLAARVGTSISAISRLEDADYDGHSLNVLVRVMMALNRRLDWRVVPLQKESPARRRC